MDYIDNSGAVYLAREDAPEESRWGEFRYDPTMSFARLNAGNLVPMVNAVYEGRAIPLYYGSGPWRLTELISGYGFQIREAELSRDGNEIITFSTSNRDGAGWGKLNGELSSPVKQYSVIKYSLETGRKSGTWDFVERRWSAEFPDASGVYFPDNGNWDNFPSKTTVPRDVYVSLWNNAITDFPEFFDAQVGLKRGVSIDASAGTGQAIAPEAGGTSYPVRFQEGYVDKITNFNPAVDKLAIDFGDYGINGAISFKSVKGKSKSRSAKAINRIAKKDYELIYDATAGLLYFNENGAGKGFGGGGAFALIDNAPLLTASNFELI